MNEQKEMVQFDPSLHQRQFLAILSQNRTKLHEQIIVEEIEEEEKQTP